MLPRDLTALSFAAYPPQAKALMGKHLDLIRQLPLPFVPSLLRKIIEYDYGFPVERTAIDSELASLSSLSEAERGLWFAGFREISSSASLEHADWVNLPAQFVEQQTAYLWSTHQLDAFRAAATDYGDRLAKAAGGSEPPAMQRLGVAVVGQGVSTSRATLFKNLRKHGTFFSQVSPDRGMETLLSALNERARARPVAYGHWYVDGGAALPTPSGVIGVSYAELAHLRKSILERMQSETRRPGLGPEELRTLLARMTPADFGIDSTAEDPVLSRFKLKLLTEGSGTQIYSTSFAQWAAREVLRRAQALTLLVRFAPRQRQRPMNELIAGVRGEEELDPEGSLIDADMAAYYQWIDQQRLAGAERSAFLAWFEGNSDAVAIGPSLPRGAESHTPLEMGKLLSLILD